MVTTSHTNSPLASLLADMETDAFHRCYWERAPLYLSPSSERLATMADLVGGCRHEDLLPAIWDDPVRTMARRGDGYEYRTVAVAEAMSLYRDGATMYVLDAQRGSPRATSWMRGLADELGTPAGLLAVFCSPPDAGLPAHFDSSGVITMQLSGRKRWRIAPNRHVVSPTTNHVMGTVPRDELGLYCHDVLPAALPDDLTEVVLEPGSLLYVPPGMWHETATEAESLSLAVTFEPAPWADRVLSALRRTLLRDEAWRANAHMRPGERDAHAALLADRLAALRDAVETLDVDDFYAGAHPEGRLPAPTPAGYRRNPFASVGVSEDGTGDIRLTVRAGAAAAERTDIVAPAGSLAGIRWLLVESSDRVVLASELRSTFPELASDILSQLAMAGALSAVPGTPTR